MRVWSYYKRWASEAFARPFLIAQTGSGLLAAFFGLAKLLEWKWTATAGWVPSISFAVMAILLIVIGLVRAPYRMHQEILQERDQLKRSIAPRLRIQSVRAQDSIEKDRSTEPPIKYAAKYIKVLVVNDSETHIKNCRAFLVDAGRITFTKEDSPEPVYERAKFSDPIRFLWSLYGQPETTLLSGVPQHFDVLSCNERDNQLGFCGGVSHPLTISGFFDPPGRYQLSVRVTGDDVQTMKFDFAVNWTGECSEIEVDDNGD